MLRKSTKTGIAHRRSARPPTPEAPGSSLVVNRFVLGRHEQRDGSMLAELDFSIKNPTTTAIRRVSYEAAFTDCRGFAYGCFGEDGLANPLNCSIAPGQSFDVKNWSHFVTPALAGAAKYDSIAEVSAVLYAQEDFKLGEVSVPDQAPKSARIQRRVNSKVVEGKILCLVIRRQADNDGLVRIDCLIPIRNKSDLNLLVVARVELLKKDQLVAESCPDPLEDSPAPARELLAGAMRCFACSITLPRRMLRTKNMAVRASLTVLRPVHVAYGTKVSSPSVASDLRLLGELREP